MARTILVTDSDLIDSWYNKVNTLSDYMGDLDNLNTTFNPGNTWSLDGYPSINDSSLVTAVDYIGREVDDIYGSLLGGTQQSTRKVTMKIFADSGQFNELNVNQLWNYDSAMTLGYLDPSWFGDSPGTADFDFTADSAKFENLNILRLREYPDSATFGKLTILDSGHITNLTSVDPTALIIFKSLRWKYQLGVIDSSLVLNTIRINHFISDSSQDSGVNITTATLQTGDINTLILTDSDSPTVELKYARPFLLTDSTGAQNYFAAYQLDADSV